MYRKASYTQRVSYIWQLNPYTTNRIKKLCDHEMNRILELHEVYKIHLIFDRPVFYSDCVNENEIQFREYLP